MLGPAENKLGFELPVTRKVSVWPDSFAGPAEIAVAHELTVCGPASSFTDWLATLRPLCDAIAELLWITRQHGKPRQEIARGGVYHITFERDTPIQLVRIALPAASGLYPETSGSHYRCSVRLLAWNGLQTRPQQTTEDVPFTLTCCT
jgi:cell division protein ZapD